MKRVFKIFLIMILCLVFLAGTVFADSPTNINKFLNQDTDARGDVETVLNAALSIIQTIGVAAAVIMLVVLGIKYMVSSVSERAEIKKHAIVYVVGALLLFGGAGIVSIIKQFATKAIK